MTQRTLDGAEKDIDNLLELIDKLYDGIEEIRDLARTGIAPMSYNMTLDEWRTHKLNRIADMTDRLLKGGDE